MNARTIQTVLHSYSFDIRNPDQAAEYAKLAERLKANNGDCFCTWGGNGSHFMPDFNGATVDLETRHLFNNQWNTAAIHGHSKGLRVFDWAEDYPINFPKSLKRGHYLDITPEMREARATTATCRYCGAHEPAGKFTFCPHCIDSEYLTEKDLRLTRMIPVDDDSTPAELTESERAELLPKFREAQLHGVTERGKARMAKARQDVIEKSAKTIDNATTERDGMLWLLDHGVRTDNVIFYSHTGRFGFGWRKPVNAAEKSALLDILTEFNFDYDIKGE